MVMISPFVCAYCRTYAPAVGELCQRCHTEESRWTPERLETVIAKQRPSMPGSRVEDYMPVNSRAVRPTNYDVPDGYERSPSTVLDPLIASGRGGFTRAMIDADKYLREHPDRPCIRATANADQSRVTLQFVEHPNVTFTGGSAEVRVHTSRNVVSAHRRLLILKFLYGCGPQCVNTVAAAVDLPANKCRELMRNCEWFVMIPGRKKIDMRYTVSAAGKSRYRKDTEPVGRKRVSA